MKWGRKKKAAAWIVVLDVVISAILCLNEAEFMAIGLNVLACLCAVALYIGNRILLQSNWYRQIFVDPDHEVFPDNVWYRAHDERNFDLVNLGSSSSYYAFQYDGLPVKAMNWARQPQALLDDIRLVKNFHSILKDGGYVLISIMPFTSINKKTGFYDCLRYVNTLDGELLDPQYRRKAGLVARYPILFAKAAIKPLIKCLLGRDRKIKSEDIDHNPLSDIDLKQNAAGWVACWKREFSINNLHAPLTNQNQKGREVRIAAMRELVDFCRERGYRPVYVILPMTRYLKEHLDADFQQRYIYDYLNQVGRNIPILDYLKDDTLSEVDLYRDAYFLNKRGGKLFTRIVLSDLDSLPKIGE